MGVELYNSSPLLQHVPLTGGGPCNVVNKVLLQLYLLYKDPVGQTGRSPDNGLLPVANLLNKPVRVCA